MKETVNEEYYKELIEIIDNIEINSLTPIEAMKKLIAIKEKLANINK